MKNGEVGETLVIQAPCSSMLCLCSSGALHSTSRVKLPCLLDIKLYRPPTEVQILSHHRSQQPYWADLGGHLVLGIKWEVYKTQLCLQRILQAQKHCNFETCFVSTLDQDESFQCLQRTKNLAYWCWQETQFTLIPVQKEIKGKLLMFKLDFKRGISPLKLFSLQECYRIIRLLITFYCIQL